MHSLQKKGNFFKEDKKGLSTVVANLLLILLVLIAIGIVWVVIRNILSSGTQNVELTPLTLTLSIKAAYISGTDILVTVQRNAGAGTMTGIAFVFSNLTNSVIINKTISMKELETDTFTFTSPQAPGIGAGNQVSVAPIYASSGTQKTSQPTDTATISGTVPPGGGGGNGGTGNAPYCGDGAVNQISEQCDLASQNGVSGSGCTSSCTLVSNSPSCNHNNAIDNGELCDGTNLNGNTCQSLGFTGGTLLCNNQCAFNTSQCTDSGPMCGNNIIDSGEQCDGTALNGQTCQSQGFNNGTLTCGNYCSFNTSQCYNIPPACNGTWNGQSDINAGLQCDGTPLPHGCMASCMCEFGFHSNQNGGCNINATLNNGTINSVWNNIYFDSQNFPKNSTVTSYIGYWVNFSSSSEKKCYQITFADYITPPPNISYIRVTDPFTATIPNISSGQKYNIWLPFNCTG